MSAVVWTRTRTTLAAASFTLALAALAPASASAGGYRYYTCKTPTGAVAPIDGWSSSATAVASSLTNDCAGGGPLRALMNGSIGQSAGAVLTWRFDAPPNTSIAAFRIWRSVTVSYPVDGSLPNYLLARGANNHANSLESCSYAVSCSAKGSHNNSMSAANFISGDGLAGVDSLFFNLTCENAACPGRGEQLGDLRIHAAELTLSDGTGPTASNVAGTLTAGGAHRGVEQIELDAADSGGGVYRLVFEVDDKAVREQVVRDNGGSCADAGANASDDYEFLARVPCPAFVQDAEVQLDTTAIPDGAHTLRVVLEDAGGNRTTIHGPAPFTVDNVPPPSVSSPGPQVRVDGDQPIPGAVARGDRGAWTGDSIAYSTAWLRCSADGSACSEIEGATTASYLISDADIGRRLRYRVTASNSEGSTVATSEPTAAVFRPQAVPERTPRPDPVTGVESGAGTTTSRGSGEPNGANASDRAQLSASFGRSRSSSQRSRYGEPIAITGRLLDPDERPISGARLVVLAQPMARSARFEEVGLVRTDSDGAFRYSLAAGPSRVVRIGYHARLGDTQFADTTQVTVLVQAGVTLRGSPRKLRNGSTATFHGRVSGPLPVRGVLVDLQARVGRGWRTFAVVRTASTGRYRFPYRFRQTYAATRYRFRARVRRDSDFPYLAGTSRIASLLVRP